MLSLPAGAAKRTSHAFVQHGMRAQVLHPWPCGASQVACRHYGELLLAKSRSAGARTLSVLGSCHLTTTEKRPSSLSLRSSIPNIRTATTMSGPYGTSYEAVVIGAGPAGITVLGNLLEQKLSPILWVDDSFSGGRINRAYREVPSNTKVKLFIDFATAVSPFRKIVSNTPSRSRYEEPSESDGVAVSGKQDKLQALRDLDQEKGCSLSHAADMCLMLTEGLKKTAGVSCHKGKVSSAIFDESSRTWTVRLDNERGREHNAGTESNIATVQTKRIVLCTGSSPNNAPLPLSPPIPSLHVLDLDCVLSPTLLAQALAPQGPATVAVIGASHSAVLCLMNLYNLARTSKSDLRIKWLTRHPLRYAEQMDGWILRDNTGLKGEAATFARENLEPETIEHSDVGKYLDVVRYPAGQEEQVFREKLQDVDYYVQAIGYSPDQIPALSTTAGQAIEPVYDHENGSFTYSTSSSSDAGKQGESKMLPGLFGAGIAYPERVTDPHGNVEMAVGFWKFMRYIKRVVPGWV